MDVLVAIYNLPPIPYTVAIAHIRYERIVTRHVYGINWNSGINGCSSITLNFNDMMDRLGLLVFGLAFGVALTTAVFRSIEPEYGVELLNCELVKLKSNRTGEVYYCTPEELPMYLDLDNL